MEFATTAPLENSKKAMSSLSEHAAEGMIRLSNHVSSRLKENGGSMRSRNSGSGKTALVLGSGGARGWAHIGVIRALEERGIHPDIVVGTSIGALVGGIYAAGGLPYLHQAALKLDWKKVFYHFFEVSLPRSGLLDGSRIEEFVSTYVRRGDIESLPLTFMCVATDIMTGNEVVIARGDLIRGIRASISVPGMFTPVRWDAKILVDGGLVNPLPVSVARRAGAERVIAVELMMASLRHRLAPKPSAARGGSKKKARVPLSIKSNNKAALRLAEAIIRRLNKTFAVRETSSLLGMGRGRPRREAIKPNIFEVLGRSFRIIEAQVTLNRLKTDPPDILIQPETGDLGFMDYHRAEEAIATGYNAARAALERQRHSV